MRLVGKQGIWVLSLAVGLGAATTVLSAQVLPVPTHHPTKNDTTSGVDHTKAATSTQVVKSSPSLSLEEAIMLNMRSNPAVINARLDRVVQQFALRTAQHQFKPQFTLTASTERQYALSGLASTDSHILPGVIYHSPLGTQWSLGLTEDFTSPHTGQTTASTTATASVTQPLLKGAGKVAGYALLDAEENEQLNQQAFRQNVMAQITAVIKSYHQLVSAYHTVTINRMAMQDSLRELDHFKLKQQLGKVANADMLTQEAQVASQRFALVGSEDALDESRQSLLSLLGLDPRMDLVPEFDIDLKQASHAVPDKTTCVHMALANDTGYQGALAALTQAKRGVKKSKQDTWWQLDLTASTALTRGKGPETRSHTGDKTVGLSLTVPIDDLDAKQALSQAKITLTKDQLAVQTTKQAIETQIINLLRRLDSQKTQVTMAERAVALAQQTLNNAKLKLQYGRASAFEVITLREALTNKQLDMVTAKIAYVDTYADVSLALGKTLNDWHITLREGVS